MPKLDHCCLFPKDPPVFIQLGRHGDLILLFPAFKLIHERTGLKPIVIVSDQYADVFQGISYATPHVIKGHWYNDMPKARQIAEQQYGGAIIPHWWQPGSQLDDVPPGPMILQCHGHMWGCSPERYPDFGTSMWLRAGFTREEMIQAPLVFDRRNPALEAELVKRFDRPPKPMLLYNFTGQSSPFGYVPELMALLQPFRAHFNMVDLGLIRARRIFDLLGLYDQAAGLITIDTSTMHLAPASKVPTLWLTVPGWGTSVPRGPNMALHVPYDQVPRRLADIKQLVQSWVKP